MTQSNLQHILTTNMKMPERSRTSRVSQIVQTFCPKVPFFVMDLETYTNSKCDVKVIGQTVRS